MSWSAALAVVAFVFWIGLAFGLAVPSGWIHVLLAASVLLAAKAIVDADPLRRKE